MINFLIHRFVKDYSNFKDPQVRTQYGKFTSITGLIVNVGLFAAKLIVGLVSNSIAIVSDSINNLSDAATQFINLFGFVMSGKPADKDHPFGHGRTEYISGFIMSILIITIGIEFFKSSVDRIMNPSDLFFSPVMVFILAGSILVKGWLFFFYRKIGKTIQSQSMTAASVDSLSDIGITFVTLISLLVYAGTGISIDGYVGILVSLVVLYAGYSVAKEALTPLLGRSPDPAIVSEITRRLKEDDCVLGVHDVIVHDYGPGRMIASAHVEVCASQNFLEIHDSVDLLEKRIASEMGIPLTLHMDPINTDDPKTKEMKEAVEEILLGISEQLSLHDFRVVYGKTHTNLIFDVTVPVDVKASNQEITKHIENALQKKSSNTYFLVVQYDRFFL
jgi:cation diffusion facilitator family transporter